MQYSRIAGILRMMAQERGYRQYIWDKLLRPTGVEVSANLPDRMATPIAQLALRQNYTPSGRLENPISLLGFKIGYPVEWQFRNLLREIFVEGCYFFQAERPDPVIVDCGSNIGISIIFFKALYPEARVIGFEPDPSTFTQLTENVRLNGLASVELHNIALAEMEGNTDFFISAKEQSSLWMSVHQERLPGIPITVPTKRLSTFIPDRVDLMKMDIEGSETGVLGELEASGALVRIEQIHLEYHHHITPTRDSMSEILAILERNGFGYQIQARSPNWPTPTVYQDLALFAYRHTGEVHVPKSPSRRSKGHRH
jgi:FkbM family methyltransferase